MVAETTALTTKLDGRSVGSKEHAAWLIEQLNAIDPQLMEDLELRPQSEPHEIPKDADDKQKERIREWEIQRRELWKRRLRAERRFAKLSYEVQGWARIWFHPSTKLDARKYLHDKAGHQAVRIINHVHDKPVELNLNLNLAEAIGKARKRLGDLR